MAEKQCWLVMRSPTEAVCKKCDCEMVLEDWWLQSWVDGKEDSSPCCDSRIIDVLDEKTWKDLGGW